LSLASVFAGFVPPASTVAWIGRQVCLPVWSAAVDPSVELSIIDPPRWRDRL